MDGAQDLKDLIRSIWQNPNIILDVLTGLGCAYAANLTFGEHWGSTKAMIYGLVAYKLATTPGSGALGGASQIAGVAMLGVIGLAPAVSDVWDKISSVIPTVEEVWAQNPDPDNIPQEINAKAQAECEEELKEHTGSRGYGIMLRSCMFHRLREWGYNV